jgi:hypothetical protein
MGKLKIPNILAVPIYIVILVAFGFLVSLISKWLGAYSPQAWGFFSAGGVLLGVIIFVWLRQIWWFVSGKGDYQGREGWLKRLWNKVFNK